jgi:hypothetical protein
MKFIFCHRHQNAFRRHHQMNLLEAASELNPPEFPPDLVGAITIISKTTIWLSSYTSIISDATIIGKVC